MPNKEYGLNRKEIMEVSIIEDEIFIGEGDEIIPNCEGGPCNYVYRERIEVYK